MAANKQSNALPALAKPRGARKATASAGLGLTPARFGAIFSEAYPELSDVQRKMLAELALLWVLRREKTRLVGGGAE